MQLIPVSVTPVVRPEVFTPVEDEALVGFFAGYSGLTRDAYQLDLRQYVQWCTEHQVTLFGARRADMKASAASWKPGAGRVRRSLGGCARSPTSTATQSKRA